MKNSKKKMKMKKKKKKKKKKLGFLKLRMFKKTRMWS